MTHINFPREYPGIVQLKSVVGLKMAKNGTKMFEVCWMNSWLSQEQLEALFTNAHTLIEEFLSDYNSTLPIGSESIEQYCFQFHREDSSASPVVSNQKSQIMKEAEETFPVVRIKEEEFEDEIDREGTLYMCDICNAGFKSHKSLFDHKRECMESVKNSSQFLSLNIKREDNSPDSTTEHLSTTAYSSLSPSSIPSCVVRTSSSSSSFNDMVDNNLTESCENIRTFLTHNSCEREYPKPNPIGEQCNFCDFRTDDEKQLKNHTFKYHYRAHQTYTRRQAINSVLQQLEYDQVAVPSMVDPNFQNHNPEISSPAESHDLDDNIFECENCQMTFADREYLTRHQVRCKNQNEANFRCEICRRGFTTKGSLELHIDHVHLKKKDFGCSVCGKLFSRKHILKVHMDTHSGKREFECTTCGKTFLQKGNLNRHERIHTAKNYGYKCRYCGQAFTQNKHLQKHTSSQHLVDDPLLPPVRLDSIGNTTCHSKISLK